MKTLCVLLAVILSGLPATFAAEKGKTLASTIDVYVFPKDAQQPDQQSKDEAACYEWAVNNSGNDPFELKKQSAAEAERTEKAKAEAQNAGKGAGARGAIRGAAAGAVIGEIADDDASDGVAIGAAAGAIRGRRLSRQAKQEAAAEAERQGQARQEATAEQVENFKKAFSVCLEAKDYLVKY